VVGDVVVGIADEELVDRVRRGDAQAFRVLVDRHRAWLTARCRRHLGGDAHAAEDVAQECLVALQRTVVAGDKPMRVRPWLSVVARNRCIDESRKLRAVPTATVPDAAVFDPEVGGEDPHLMRAWSALTGRHRTVLELRELGGLSYEEIAVALAVTAGAVETLLFRARGALRREYARAGGKVAAMAPIQEAVAQASGRQGVLSRLAGEAGARADGLTSLVGRGPNDVVAAADGVLSSAADRGSASSWFTDLQARLVSSPAFEPVVNAGAGQSGGRLRVVLAGLGVLLGTVAVTVPSLEGATTTTPPAPTATVPQTPAPAPGTTTASTPDTPPTSVEADPPASAPEAPAAPPADAPAPPGAPDPMIPGALAPLAEPVSPLLEGASTTVTSIVEGVQTPLDELLQPVVRLPGS
jgi:RNA polymerase sigma-70 factor (ECF subfamily)